MDRPRHFIVRGDGQRSRAADACWSAPVNWEIIIRPHKSKRNLQQNACMWAMNTAAAEYVGCSPADFHEIAKAEYFGVKQVQVQRPHGRKPDRLITIINGGTSKLNVEEMSRYIDWLQTFVTENCEVDGRSIRRSYRVEAD